MSIRVLMRALTHANIGATLGLVAWMLWMSLGVVTGHAAPEYRPGEVRALMQASALNHPHAHNTGATAGSAGVPPCHELPPSAERPALSRLSGDDL